MTRREFLNAVLNANISAELSEYAIGAIAQLDKQNEKRKTAPSALKKAAEADGFDVRVLALMDTEQVTTSGAISERLGVSPSAVSGSLRRLVSKGLVADCGFAAAGKNGRAVKTYRKAQ